MNRRIHIALLASSPVWSRLLGQLGASFSVMNPEETVHPGKVSCVIVNRAISDSEKESLETYMNMGGSLIDTAGAWFPFRSSGMDILYPQPDSPFAHIERLPVHSRCLTLRNGGLLNGTVSLPSGQEDALAWFGLPLEQMFEPYRTKLTAFAHSQHPAVLEETAAVPSMPIVQLLQVMFVRLHHHIGIPFLHTGWNGLENDPPFTFRIDSDFGSPDAIRELQQLCRDHQIPATWFLHTEPLRDQPHLFTDSEDVELALHGYHHTLFSSAESAAEDIRRGLQWFQQQEIDVTGYAAPYGQWNRALHQALRSSAFRYSSEFGYDFGGLPSRPDERSPLQLPVFPISIGTLKTFGYTPSMMIDFFMEQIRVHSMLGLPLHLYHHPNDGHIDVWETIFSALKPYSFRPMTYSQWAVEWSNRPASCHCIFNGSNVQIDTEADLHDVPYLIHWPSGKSTITRNKTATPDQGEPVTDRPEELKLLLSSRRKRDRVSSITRIKQHIRHYRWRKRS